MVGRIREKISKSRAVSHVESKLRHERRASLIYYPDELEEQNEDENTAPNCQRQIQMSVINPYQRIALRKLSFV